jgi:hypothetical protein
VDEMEQKLQERETLDDLRLERDLIGLAMHESSLEKREVAVTPHVFKPHDYVNHMFMRP